MTRLAFFGSPEVAAVALQALHGAGHEVALVVTAPDRRRGRGSAQAPTAVKKLALDLKIPVSSEPADVLGAKVELGVVVAYGALIRGEVLARVPMVNLHFSLLPRWRGAAPVERAILAGDERTGVCLMALEKTLDTGPLYDCVEVSILPAETAAELRSRLSEIGAALLVERLAFGVESLGMPVPQEGEPVYAAKIDPAERHLDWELAAVQLDRVVRVGRAWTTFRGRRLIVERARVAGEGDPEPEHLVPGTLLGDEVICGAGRLELLEVRPEGRAAQSFDAWRRGARPNDREQLGA